MAAAPPTDQPANNQNTAVVDQKDQKNDDNTNQPAQPTTSSTVKPQVFFVLGGPGAGKGTQCQNLVKEFGLIHLSAGDLLRAERNDPNSPNGTLINNYIKEGKIVPVEITVKLIKKAMQLYISYGKLQFIIDGFPRNMDNYNGWNKIMSDFAEIPFLLYLECNEDEMTKRILLRAKNAAPDAKRKDDNIDTIKKRFNVFNNDTVPVINIFKSLNKCRSVNSIGDIDEIYANARKLFIKYMTKPQIIFVLGGPGSGKGTQCAKLVNDATFKNQFVHLSAGDLLRKERNDPNSPNGTLINNYINEGKIVPVSITVNLIKTAIENELNNNGKSIFIIDGFPRNIDNYNGWNKIMTDDICNVSFVLLLDCSEDEMMKRILNRAATSVNKRIDDNKDTILKRFKVYKESTLPVVAIYEQTQPHKLYKINSNSTIPVSIYNNSIKKLFMPFIRKPDVIFVLGGPGAGKGTQCSRLVTDYGFVHLSAGDLLRAERNSGSSNATLINNYIKEGKIVPVEITIDLIKRAMLKSMRIDNKYIFIIDGFPRNADNLSGWNRICGDYFANVPFLLHLECSEDEMTKRILLRAKNAAPDAKRKDDNVKTIKKRFGVYNTSTMSVVNVFRNQNKCVDVDALDTKDNVYAKVKNAFVKHLNL